MNAHAPISTCNYETRIERRGNSVVMIQCPSDPAFEHVEITFTPDEAETIGADLIEAARGMARARA